MLGKISVGEVSEVRYQRHHRQDSLHNQSTGTAYLPMVIRGFPVSFTSLSSRSDFLVRAPRDQPCYWFSCKGKEKACTLVVRDIRTNLEYKRQAQRYHQISFAQLQVKLS